MGIFDPRFAGLVHNFDIAEKLIDLNKHGLRTVSGETVPDAESHMGDGFDVIVESKLSDGNHRFGSPDVLIRDPSITSRYRYWPVEIKLANTSKRHGVDSASSKEAYASRFETPYPDQRKPTGRFEPKPHLMKRTLLQLSHYWRILEATDRASLDDGPIWAGVIGGLPEEPDSTRITWFDLNDQTTFKQRPSNLPVELWPGGPCSALDLYDAEFRYRLHIATKALEQKTNSAVEHPAPPHHHKECSKCHRRKDCDGTGLKPTIFVRSGKSLRPMSKFSMT